MSMDDGDNIRVETENYWNLSKSKGHNPAENYSTVTKFEPIQRVLISHPYVEFQFKISICLSCDGDNQWKLTEFFLQVQGA